MSDENEAEPVQQDPPPQRARKRRRWRRAVVVTLSLLVIAIGLPLIFLALTATPVRAPDWITTRIEQNLNGRIGTGRISVDQIEMIVDRSLRPRIQMRNVGIFDAGGSEIARLNEVRARLAFTQLLQGGVTMKALRVSGAQITMRRRSDGTFALSFGQGEGATGNLASVLDGLDRAFASKPLSELDIIAADQLTITLEDSRSGR